MTRLFATMVLALSVVGTALAAGGTYDEEDPFDERQRITRFLELGGDLSKDQAIEFQFDFEDRPETRAEHAQAFAFRLRRMGYPNAAAKPCARAERCWFVVASKQMRIDEKKLIALSKELDQLAADDYGRYRGWDSELFHKEDSEMQALLDSASASPTVGKLLETLEQFGNLRCNRFRPTFERDVEQARATGKLHEVYSTRRALDMMCSCMPGRARQMSVDLPPAEREATITEEEFFKRYAKPGIFHPCAAQMMRKLWREDCPRFMPAGKVPDTYCPCMLSLVEAMSETEIAQVALDSANYLPLVAQADREGKSRPLAPPAFKQFAEQELTCRK